MVTTSLKYDFELFFPFPAYVIIKIKYLIFI